MAWEKIKRYDPSTPIALEDGMIDNDPPIYEPIYEYHIPNAMVNGYGYITKNFRNIEEIVSPRHRGSLSFKSIVSNYLLKKKIRVNKSAISITNGWYDNFYHFSFECLAKLFLLKDHLPLSTVVLPKKLSKFHLEWMDLLGVTDITYLEENQIVDAPLAISSNFPNRDLNYHHQLLLDFKQWVLEKFQIVNLSVGNKILVGRPEGSKRNLANIVELKNNLIPLGFTYVEMEDYTLIEQISIFRNANFIVAVHGAALTHLLFCKENTRILDLIHREYNVLCFYKLAKHLNLSYQMVKCIGETG
jgi:capsular polysaccharide biosynthesis protein